MANPVGRGGRVHARPMPRIHLDKHFPCTGLNSIRTICERAKLRSSSLGPVRRSGALHMSSYKTSCVAMFAAWEDAEGHHHR